VERWEGEKGECQVKRLFVNPLLPLNSFSVLVKGLRGGGSGVFDTLPVVNDVRSRFGQIVQFLHPVGAGAGAGAGAGDEVPNPSGGL